MFSAGVHLNVKQICELDLVLFAPRCIEGKIEPLIVCAPDQCHRLGILAPNDVPSSFKEQIRQKLPLWTEQRFGDDEENNLLALMIPRLLSVKCYNKP